MLCLGLYPNAGMTVGRVRVLCVAFDRQSVTVNVDGAPQILDQRTWLQLTNGARIKMGNENPLHGPDQAHLTINAPRHIRVVRDEVAEAI